MLLCSPIVFVEQLEGWSITMGSGARARARACTRSKPTTRARAKDTGQMRVVNEWIPGDPMTDPVTTRDQPRAQTRHVVRPTVPTPQHNPAKRTGKHRSAGYAGGLAWYARDGRACEGMQLTRRTWQTWDGVMTNNRTKCTNMHDLDICIQLTYLTWIFVFSSHI